MPTLWEIERWIAQDPKRHLGLDMKDGKFEARVYKDGAGSVAKGSAKSLEGAVGIALEDLRLSEAKRQVAPPLPPGYKVVAASVAPARVVKPAPAPPPPAPAPGAYRSRYGGVAIPNVSMNLCGACNAPSATHVCVCGCHKPVCASCYIGIARSGGRPAVQAWVANDMWAACQRCSMSWSAGVKPTCVCP